MFSFFAILTWGFHVQLNRIGVGANLSWRRHIAVLYALSLIFIMRNIVRIFEFLQGGQGYITTHESMLYLLDATLMLVVTVILMLVHPGQLIKAAHRAEKEGWRVSNELTPFVA
jgi:hypothetical protein